MHLVDAERGTRPVPDGHTWFGGVFAFEVRAGDLYVWVLEYRRDGMGRPQRKAPGGMGVEADGRIPEVTARREFLEEAGRSFDEGRLVFWNRTEDWQGINEMFFWAATRFHGNGVPDDTNGGETGEPERMSPREAMQGMSYLHRMALLSALHWLATLDTGWYYAVDRTGLVRLS